MNKLSKPLATGENKMPEIRLASVEPLILMAALRYALGRKSYVVGAVADAIEQNLDVFNKFQLKKMLEEIAEELKDGGGGHSWDIETWQALMRRIEEVSADKFDINLTKEVTR